MSRGTLHSAYVSQVAQAGLTRDRNQEQVIGKLDELRTRLIDQPREFTYWAHRLRRLLPGKRCRAGQDDAHGPLVRLAAL